LNNSFFTKILNIVRGNDPEIEKYLNENYPEDITIEALMIYREYISLFKPCKINVKFNEDFSEDKDLVLSFIAGFQGSKYDFEADVDNFEMRFCIHAVYENNSIRKFIDELFSFQIHNLLCIYLSNFILLEKIVSESTDDTTEIERQRREKINEWNYKNALAESKAVYLKLIKI